MWLKRAAVRTFDDLVWYHALTTMHTRLGRQLGLRYHAYLAKCRREAHQPVEWTGDEAANARHFREMGYATFRTPETETAAVAMLERIESREAADQAPWSDTGEWDPADVPKRFPEVFDVLEKEIGGFLRATYKSHYKIWYGKLYRSLNDGTGPSGSQLWHSDGGPGTCINLMFCVSAVSARNGSMECLPWRTTLKLSRREMGAASFRNPRNKNVRKAFYEQVILRDFKDAVVQPESPPGLVYAFRNNCIHRGGWPEPNERRYVFVFHVYPASHPTPFDKYRKDGVVKRGSYPIDPAFDE